MYDISFPIAFGAGLVSFFAPCVVPLLPAYIGYVTGVSVEDLRKRGIAFYRRKLFISSLFYVVGFSLVFVALGGISAGIGRFFRSNDTLIQRIGGFLIIVFGLEFAGYLRIPILARNMKIKLPKWTNNFENMRAFFVGVIFASAWTPCVGVVLGSILALAASQATVARGAGLLFVYSLGISIPFLFASLALSTVSRYVKFINRRLEVVSKVAGLLLVALGLMLLTDTYKYVNAWVFDIGFKFGYQIR